MNCGKKTKKKSFVILHIKKERSTNRHESINGLSPVTNSLHILLTGFQDILLCIK